MLRIALPASLLVLAAAPNELVFAPAAEAAWTTSIDLKRTLSGGELSVEMGGQEVPAMFLPTLNMTNDVSLRLVVRDTVKAAGDEGALSLLRRYEVAHREERGRFLEAGEEVDSWNDISDSPVTDRTIRFERDSADEGFSASLGDEDDSPIVTLSKLAGHLPGTELLPEDAVEIGESWTLSDEVLRCLLVPGGDLGFVDQDGESRDEREAGGRLRATLDSVDESGLASIQLEGTLTESWEQEVDLEKVPVTDGKANETSSWEFEIEGTLLWDTAKGRCRSIALEGAGNYSIHTVRDPKLEGATYVSDLVMDAEYSFELSTDAPAKAAEAGSNK